MAEGLLAEVRARVERLDLPWNRYGLDRFGTSKEHLVPFYAFLGWFYRHYFRVTSFGVGRVPTKGPVLLIGNHSGGIPVDAGMAMASLFFDHEPPLHAHGMVEYFVQKWPFFSSWYSRLGHLPGVPEHAKALLEHERHLMVFPEGARGTGKLYRDRYKLVRFGTGFMRLALRARAPIVPFAFIGGEEAVPSLFHLGWLARLIRAPYIPVPPQIVPWPLPVACHIHYGEPLTFEGDGTEVDELIQHYVDVVRDRVAGLIAEGLAVRKRAFRFSRVRPDEAASAGTAASAGNAASAASAESAR